MKNKNIKYSLYISFDGLLDPLGSSQVLPYIENLSKSGYMFLLFSFEKEDRKKDQINKLNERLRKMNIKWVYFPFWYERFGYFKRIFKLFIYMRNNLDRKSISSFHIRGIFPAPAYFLGGFQCPLIFDIRAFAGEYIDCGRIKKNSFFSYLLKLFEKYLIRKSSGIVVLDQSGAEYIKNNYYVPEAKLKVIPTCTNTKSFDIKNKLPISNSKKPYRFVFLGGARFPYRADLAVILIKNLLDNRMDCSIDFINERDQDLIKKICKESNLHKDKYNVFSLPHDEVYKVLFNYNCGLIFNTSGLWRSMSCPTKLGEYLASGLKVISIEGIKAVDRLSAQYPKIVISFSEFKIKKGLSKIDIERIQAVTPPNKAREIAELNFDISIADKNYLQLYQSLI